MQIDFDAFVLVVCNGDPPSRVTLEGIIPHPIKVVCADGGANKALSIGYIPDIVVGDLDSLDRSDARLKGTEIVKVESQENTDFEKTLDLVLKSGWKKILVAGFGGSRIDQTLANIQIAYEYSHSKDRASSQPGAAIIVLVDEQFLVFPVIDRFSHELPEAASVSIIPMEDNTIVSARGLMYELERAKLPRGGHAISNRSTGGQVEIAVHSGGIMVFVEHA